MFNVQCTYIYSFHSCAKIQLNQRMLRLGMYLYGRCTEREKMNRRDSISRFAMSQLNKNRRTKKPPQQQQQHRHNQFMFQ